MTTDSFFALAIGGMLALFFGTVLLLGGYRFFLILLPILGFFFGFGLGAQTVQALFGGGFLSTVTGWIVGFGVAVIFALLSYLFYFMAVGLIGGMLGYALGAGLMQAIGFDMGFLAWLVGIVAAIVVGAGVLFLNVQKYVVIAATAILGAAVITGTFLLLFGGPAAQIMQNPVRAALSASPFLTISFLLLAILGGVAQLQTTSGYEIESYNRFAEMSGAEPAPVRRPGRRMSDPQPPPPSGGIGAVSAATSPGAPVPGVVETVDGAGATRPPTPPPEEKKGFTFPSAYTVLFLLLIVMAALTYVIPAGQYNRNPDGEPIPNTYHSVPPNPQKLLSGTLLAPISGTYGIQASDGSVSPYASGTLYGAINVALFVLVIGGFLGLTMKTGAIDAGIGALVRGLGTRGKLLIPILMCVFMLGGTTYGMAEESLAFYMLVIAALIALRYDALTGVSVILLGCGIGVLGSTINPFATGIASGFAGISLADGLIGRLVILVLCGGLGIWYVMRYAARVQADPSQSLVFHMKEDNERHFLKRESADADVVVELTGQRKLVLSLFGLAFLIMIVSVIPWADLGITFIPTLGWWFPELTALFLFFAIVIGIVGRMSEQELTGGFIDGARDLLGVALVVGLARGVSVIMNNGLIIDTVLYWCQQLVSAMGGVAFINTVALLYLPLSFLIPSSSGLATVTMPIMAPLADFAGVPRALVVTAYQSSNGLINLVTPTFAVVAGGLALGRVPLNTWWKFAAPLVLMLAGVIVLVLSAGVLIRT